MRGSSGLKEAGRVLLVCKDLYFPIIESGDQVEGIDPLANEDKHEGELIPPINLLDVDLDQNSS